MNEMLYKQLHMQISQLYEVPPEEFDEFYKLLKPVTIEKDEYFVKAGDMPRDFGFVIKGIFRLYYIDKKGNEYIKSICAEGDMIAPYSALLKNEASGMYIQALENSELLVINFKDYIKLQLQHDCWVHVSKKITEELFIKKEEREREFLLYDAESRYKRFISEYPDIENRIKQYNIASFLGITPESLSRIRKTALNK